MFLNWQFRVMFDKVFKNETEENIQCIIDSVFGKMFSENTEYDKDYVVLSEELSEIVNIYYDNKILKKEE